MRTREAIIAVAARLFDTDGYGPVAKAGAGAAVAGFVLGTLIGWLFFPDAMKPWQFGMIFALVTLLLVLLAATPYVWRRYSGQS